MERKSLHRPTTNAKIEALKKQKRLRRKKQVFVFSIFFVILFLLVVGFFHISFFYVKKIEVSGVLALSQDDIIMTTSEQLQGNTFLVFPKKNIFLVNKDHIVQQLKDTYPLINTVRIKKTFSHLSVHISERDPETLWCHIDNRSDCYFVHADGAIFEKASVSSNPLFFVFFTPLSNSSNPLNQLVLPKEDFVRIKNIKEILKKYNIDVYGYAYQSNTEELLFLAPVQHTMAFANMSHIKMYKEQTSEVVVSKILTALKTESLRKQKENNFINTEYIDIRFNEQVSFKLK